jgi:hypothetical protein
LVAQTMRTSTGIGFGAPTGWIIAVCRKRRSLVCKLRSISQISSRKSVPPFATAAAPGLSERAPVKAPLRWPNTSDSSRSRGIAAQFSGTKGFSARVETAWIARAQTSLPVPLSPVMKTVAVERPIERTMR